MKIRFAIFAALAALVLIASACMPAESLDWTIDDIAIIGEQVTVTVTMTNSGPSGLENIQLDLELYGVYDGDVPVDSMWNTGTTNLVTLMSGESTTEYVQFYLGVPMTGYTVEGCAVTGAAWDKIDDWTN